MTIKKIRTWINKTFMDAVRFSDPAAFNKKMSVDVLGCAFLILFIVSVVMLGIGDKLNARDMVLTRFMAKAQATLTAQVGYPAGERDRITVVMYDQQFLRHTDSAWPISYQDHADWLLRLAGDPNARPKAIMLDITFGQNRNDPSLPALGQALCKVQNEFKVPIFLAALPSPQTGRLTVRDGLGPAPSSGETPCYTLVGVDYIPDQLDGLAWDYRLTRHRTGTGWEDGPADALANAVQPAYRSAAMAIAQDVAHLELGVESAPLALVWGLKSAPQRERPDSLTHCKPGAYEAARYIPGVLRQFVQAPSSPLCPYHSTLSMAQVGELPEQALAPFLKDRYVLVGANVPGYNDFANSPIHGLIPGVHLHAMALDNLLTYRGNYKQSTGWELAHLPNLLLPALLAVFAVFIVNVVWRALSPKFNFFTKEKPSSGLNSADAIKLRGVQALFDALAWLLKISLKTIAAMVLIALLQWRFRIGMLPVVELVTMTLLAEGFNYMKKLGTLVHGEAKPAAAPIANLHDESKPAAAQAANPTSPVLNRKGNP